MKVIVEAIRERHNGEWVWGVLIKVCREVVEEKGDEIHCYETQKSLGTYPTYETALEGGKVEARRFLKRPPGKAVDN